jgi:hypothetical protein
VTYQKWTSEPVLVGEALEDAVDDLLRQMDVQPIEREAMRASMLAASRHLIQEII